MHLKRRIRISCPECRAMPAARHRFCPECGAGISEVVKREQEKKRIRVLPVDEDALSLAAAYFRKNQPLPANYSQRVFPINRHRAWQIIRDCAERAGIPNLINPDTGRARGVSLIVSGMPSVGGSC